MNIETTEASVHEDSINRLAIYILWGTMGLGIMFFTVSHISQGRSINDIIKDILFFMGIFATLNLLSTFAFIFIKKRFRTLIKYFISTTYALILPLFSYVSLGYNHQSWSLGIVVVIFSVLHLQIPLTIYSSILICSLAYGFIFVFRDQIIPTLYNPRSELIIMFVVFLFSTIIAIFIIKIVNKAFQQAKEKDIEVIDEKESALKTLQIVKEISGSMKDVGGRNSEISEKLSTSSEIQATSVEEIAASTEQLMASIEEISKNATKASTDMNMIVSRVQEGMNFIKSSTSEMMELVKFSKIMLDSIESINEIAENTNLLALNAAIEAARAGEAGKGFAVVATEIRKLAEKSTEAAQDVGSLLKDSEVKIKKGANINDKVNNIYIELKEQLEKISKVFQQISFATQELDRGGKEISSGLENINEASNENLSLAKEIETLNKEFEKDSKKLTQVVKTSNIH